MSDLSKPRECAEWLRDTIDYHKRPSSALRRVERAAIEQRANLRSMEFSRRYSEKEIKEYTVSVEMLEGALSELRAGVVEEERKDAEAAQIKERADAQYRERIREKFKGKRYL